MKVKLFMKKYLFMKVQRTNYENATLYESPIFYENSTLCDSKPIYENGTYRL